MGRSGQGKPRQCSAWDGGGQSRVGEVRAGLYNGVGEIRAGLGQRWGEASVGLDQGTGTSGKGWVRGCGDQVKANEWSGQD